MEGKPHRQSLVNIPAGKPPCQQACPADIDIPRYLRLISAGEFAKALAVIREKIPFPSVCGRVCFHPCEQKCQLRHLDGPVLIRALKRFVAEKSAETRETVAAKPTYQRIAIIGSGPAGLTAAYYLAKKGHMITVFEASPQPGGMLRYGIPAFILPRDIVDKEIKAILDLGIELRVNTPVVKVNQLFDAGYRAIFIATGAQEGRKLPIPGADLDGVLVGLSLLRAVNQGEKVKLGKKVLVLGGGGVACDAARTARRLGAAEVHIACLESRTAMPAYPWEIAEAEKEGVIIHPSRTFTRLVGKAGKVTGVECLKLKWMKFDDEGGLHLEPVPGSEHILQADTVIFAIGQRVDAAIVSEVNEIKISRRRTIVVDPETLATGHPGVFAGGDVVTGPASVIEAIAAGRKAASSIDRYLGGDGLIDEILVAPEEEVPPLPPSLPVAKQASVPSLPVDQRLVSFAEVELTLGEEEARNEAQRCLGCDLPILADSANCAGCRLCQLRCSLKFEGAFNPSRARLKIQRLVNQPTEYSIAFTDDCDACGLCARYCPYGALVRKRIKQC